MISTNSVEILTDASKKSKLQTAICLNFAVSSDFIKWCQDSSTWRVLYETSTPDGLYNLLTESLGLSDIKNSIVYVGEKTFPSILHWWNAFWTSKLYSCSSVATQSNPRPMQFIHCSDEVHETWKKKKENIKLDDIKLVKWEKKSFFPSGYIVYTPKWIFQIYLTISWFKLCTNFNHNDLNTISQIEEAAADDFWLVLVDC